MSQSIKDFYNIFAGEYCATFFNELDNKPFDREILTRFAHLTKDRGIVCDVGCGPGHIGWFLYKQGVAVAGVDLSETMLEQARVHCPGIEFHLGDMLNLSWPDASLTGVVSFYAIVHLRASEVELALREFCRVLAPGGYLLFSTHIGDQVIRVDKSDGDQVVSADYIFHDPDLLISSSENAGFNVMEAIIRYPYQDVEYPSKRAYILARKY